MLRAHVADPKCAALTVLLASFSVPLLFLVELQTYSKFFGVTRKETQDKWVANLYVKVGNLPVLHF